MPKLSLGLGVGALSRASVVNLPLPDVNYALLRSFGTEDYTLIPEGTQWSNIVQTTSFLILSSSAMNFTGKMYGEFTSPFNLENLWNDIYLKVERKGSIPEFFMTLANFMEDFCERGVEALLNNSNLPLNTPVFLPLAPVYDQGCDESISIISTEFGVSRDITLNTDLIIHGIYRNLG
jgi:hypothetical protein